LRASRPEPHLRSTQATLRLALYSLKALAGLDELLKLDYQHLSRGTLKVFRERKALLETQRLAEELRPLGLESRFLDPDAAVAMEPLLADASGKLVGAIHYPQDGCGDAYLFTTAVQRHAAAAGVRFRFATEITGIQSQTSLFRFCTATKATSEPTSMWWQPAATAGRFCAHCKCRCPSIRSKATHLHFQQCPSDNCRCRWWILSKRSW